jgi:cytosine/adenosine deaminase-related metal-dependent hydrolase
MSYRKLKADYLFDGFELHGPDTVLICRQDGMVEDLVTLDQAGGDIEHYSGLLSPGFINCHCHLELSHLRGQIHPQKGLVHFVLSVMDQRKKHEESIQDSMQEAETEMLLAGIVAVGDICNSGDSLEVKTKNRLDYYNFIELLGWLPSQAASRFNDGTKLASAFLECLGDKNHLSLNPHSPYSISKELWDMLIPEFPGKTITIHNQESADENELFEAGSGGLFNLYAKLKIKNDQFIAPGTHSLPFYLDKLKTASRILLVHNTYMDYSDLNIAASFHEGLFFCLCPNANYFIEKKLPDIDALVKKTGNIVLGTDSLASNTQLSILEEMKMIKSHFPSIPTTSLLTWATSNGSKALHFEERLGDFTKLKKPGIVLINHLENGEIGDNSFSRRIL